MNTWLEKIKTIKRFKNRSIYGFPGGHFLSQDAIFKVVKTKDVEFSGCDEYQQLLSCILNKEIKRDSITGHIYKFTQGDVKLLNRIMKNGGLSAYLSKLEKEVRSI